MGCECESLNGLLYIDFNWFMIMTRHSFVSIVLVIVPTKKSVFKDHIL